MTTTKPLTEQTPQEIDEQLAAAWGELYVLQDKQARLMDWMHEALGDHKPMPTWENRYPRYARTDLEVLTEASEHRKSLGMMGDRAAQILTDWDQVANQIMTLRWNRIIPFNEEFDRRGGWTRAYLVLNSNGHVHKTMACNTCHVTTRFGWVTDLSGHSEAEIVGKAGESACTVCYPSAPLDVLKRKSTIELPEQREARLVREAEKAKRDAEKAAKGITNPDGTVLRDAHGYPIKTERTALFTLVGYLFNTKHYGYDGHIEACDRILAALVFKTGKTEAEVKEMVASKLAAKEKREAR